MGDLAIQHHLSSRVIRDFFIGQNCHQALLQGAKPALDLALGLRAGSHQMGYAQGREGPLKLRGRVSIISHGIVSKEAESVRVNDQGQAVLKKEAAEMLKMIPGGICWHEDRPQEFS